WTGSLRVSQMWGLLDPEPLATSRLSLFVRQQSSALGGTLIFDPSSVDAAWVEAFPGRLEAIISGLAVSPASSLEALLAIGKGKGKG
ncbi:MAG: hypothetical protein JWM91_4179, partial [Rhodospirillales bacterium]|nr:hypothetical protein [Rhodospirillales bacterium]